MKLKATDLMIGDWVIDYKDRFVRVHGIEPTWNEIWVNYANGSGIYKSNVDFTKPIPLTTELLEKCGFRNNFGNHTLTISNGGIISIYLSDDSWGIYSSKDSFRFGNSYSNNNKINYLHQLQQLVRILTKQELIIKESPN